MRRDAVGGRREWYGICEVRCMRATLIDAEPETIAIDTARIALVIIDMQRDFLEPGGFGASLGNDVSRLAPAIAPCRAMLDAARAMRIVASLPGVGRRWPEGDRTRCGPATTESGQYRGGWTWGPDPGGRCVDGQAGSARRGDDRSGEKTCDRGPVRLADAAQR